MSLLDKVSLALIPSAYKASKLYSVIPANGDGDFSFVRNSSGTRVDSNGLIESVGVNVPRLDYSDGNCPSLLLEPQRSNLITYSEDFSQSSWIKLNSSIVSNSVISPDGTLNADKIIDNTVNTAHRFISGSFTTTATNYTFSIFVKKSEIRYAYLRGNDSGGTYISGTFDLQDGVVTETIDGNLSIQDYGNGWFRVVGTAISNGNGLSYFELRTSKSPIYSNYLGNGTDGLYVYGSQVEESSFPTSYIPTNGSIATRIVETCTDAGNASTFNDSEGVLFAEISALRKVNNNIEFLSIGSGSYTNNSIYIQLRNGLNELAIWSYSGGVNQVAQIITLTDITSFNKIAIKWKLNDFDVFVNGVSVYSLNTYTPPSELNVLSFNRDGSNPIFCKCKQLIVFDTALTDTELQELTTL